jgi:O-antigen/teichoic acid export membrane protein
MATIAVAPRRGLARVMSISGAAAVASGLLSVLATKIIAVLMGPASLALLATLQQIRETAVTAATGNGQTAMIQGVSSRDGVARREYVRTAAGIFMCATAVTVLIPAAAVAKWAGLGIENAPLLRWLAIAIVLSSGFVFLNSLLIVLDASLAAILQIAGPGAMALLAWPAAQGLSFPALLALSAGVTVAGAGFALSKRRDILRPWFHGLGRWWSADAARHFVLISAPMFATGLTGSLALIAVRGNILRSQGLAVAGQFHAAWNISMHQVTLVLASLQTYYLPTLSALRSPRERGEHIAAVLTAAAPVAAAVIAGIALTKPLVLRLLYAPSFAGAGEYLRWTLLGDYLKVASWILSISMLAAADMRVFLASDLASSAVFTAFAVLLTRWRSPAESAAIAFVAMHVAHLAIGGFYAVRRHAFDWRGRAAAVWLAGLAVVGVASTLGWSL